MTDLNLNNIYVGDSGRISFSGLSSGIDFQGAVEAIIKARRIPIDTLETRIGDNDKKVEALKTLRAQVEGLRDAIDKLRGAVSFDNSKNIFEAKQAFTFATRTDGQIATQAANLLGITVSNRAQTGSHKIEILQTAEAHKVASAVRGSQSGDLNLSGTITINGTDIDVSASDSLLDLRDRINAATGTTEVRASVVQSGPSEFTLVLTAQETGRDIMLSDSAGTVLQDLGLIDGGGNILKELQAARTAQFRADNLIDQTRGRFQSDVVEDPDALLASGTGTLDLLVGGASVGTVAYDSATDSLQDVADAINADSTLAAAGISATVIRDVEGNKLRVNGTQDGFRISDSGTLLNDIGMEEDLHYSDVVTASDTALGITENYILRDETGTAVDTDDATSTVSILSTDTLADIRAKFAAIGGVDASIEEFGGGFRLVASQTGTGNSLIVEPQGSDALGFQDRARILERSSNTVTDLFEGVTVNLFNAEVGTTVEIDIEQDLSAVKTAIVDVVDAYNEVKIFINTQRQFDPNTGEPAEDAVLSTTTSLGDMDTLIRSLLGNAVGGVDEDFRVLSQVGVSFVNNATLDDPLKRDTLEIDDALLDETLIANPDDLQKLLGFDFTSTSPDVLLLDFDGRPAYRDGGYALDITWDGSQITDVSITGDTTVTPTFSGRNITIDVGGAKGLELFFSGNASVTGVNIDFTKGVGSELFFGLDQILDQTSGTIAAEIDRLEDTNTQHEARIDQMETRLEVQRQSLLNSFIAMESALSQFNSTRSTLEQMLGGGNSNR